MQHNNLSHQRDIKVVSLTALAYTDKNPALSIHFFYFPSTNFRGLTNSGLNIIPCRKHIIDVTSEKTSSSRYSVTTMKQ